MDCSFRIEENRLIIMTFCDFDKQRIYYEQDLENSEEIMRMAMKAICGFFDYIADR